MQNFFYFRVLFQIRVGFMQIYSKSLNMWCDFSREIGKQQEFGGYLLNEEYQERFFILKEFFLLIVILFLFGNFYMLFIFLGYSFIFFKIVFY